MIVLDTSILIEYFRKSKKENSAFYQIAQTESYFAITSITKYEIDVGAKVEDSSFWSEFYSSFLTIPFDGNVVNEAVKITNELKQSRQLIEFADIAIAASARVNNYSIATLNTKHFDRIHGSNLVKV